MNNRSCSLFPLILLGFISSSSFAEVETVPAQETKPAVEARSSEAETTAVDTIFFRIKAGPSFYSGIGADSPPVGVGGDLGFRWNNGFGLMGTTIFNMDSIETVKINPNLSTRTSVSTYFLGIVPHYAAKKGIATLTLGLGVGVLNIKSKMETRSGGAPPVTAPEATHSSLAVAPNVGLDFAIAGGFVFTVGVQYVVGVDGGGNPGFFSPMGGFGFNF